MKNSIVGASKDRYDAAHGKRPSFNPESEAIKKIKEQRARDGRPVDAPIDPDVIESRLDYMREQGE